MDRVPRISEAEWQVMKIIWSHPQVLAQEVIDSLAVSTDWSPATIKTLLNRLVKKKVLVFEKEGKSYRYSARLSEEKCRHFEAESFLQRVFDGSLTPMLAHFVKMRKLSPQEVEELKTLLRDEER